MELIHHHFDTLVSTNDWAKKELKTFHRDKLTLVTADEQTRGRGQYGRKWISPKGSNLYASFCFFIDENQQDPLSLTHVMAITIAQILKKREIPSHIKWPNDILVYRKKIAGILCETEYFAPQFGVIIGVGMNINMEEEELNKIEQPATSLKQEMRRPTEVSLILSEIQTLFLTHLELFLAEGFTPFLPTFRSFILPGLTNQHIL